MSEFIEELRSVCKKAPFKYQHVCSWLDKYENDIMDALEDQRKYQKILESVDGFLVGEANKMVERFTDTVIRELKKKIRVEPIVLQFDVGLKNE